MSRTTTTKRYARRSAFRMREAAAGAAFAASSIDPPPLLSDEEFEAEEGAWADEVFVAEEAAAPANEQIVSADGEVLPLMLVSGSEGMVFDADYLHDDEPPFDPPDEDDDIFGRAGAGDDDAAEAQADAPPKRWREQKRPAEPPLPCISVHVSWDSAATGDVLKQFAADPRMKRARITTDCGGIAAAGARFAATRSPDLLILDTVLAEEEALAALDRLAGVIDPRTKVIVLGPRNDIHFLRALASRGIGQYLIAPTPPEDLVRAACRLFADTDAARVIAVIGARGGVGTSSVAQSLAWSIAERQQAKTAFVDLDLSFGAAALHAKPRAEQSLAFALLSPDKADDSYFDEIALKQTARLSLFAAPATLAREFDLRANAVEAMIKRLRRMSSFVVLDLPHRWSPWVRHALVQADEVIVVATPDLASMRNAKNMLETLRPARETMSPASVILTMTGMAERPEIGVKDFAGAVGAEPIAILPFEPHTFGLSAINGAPLGETAPKSKIAATIDTVASLLTGWEIVEKPAEAPPPHKPVAQNSVSSEPLPFTFLPPRETDEATLVLDRPAPPQTEDYLHRARDAALSARAAEPATEKRRPAQRGRPGTLRAAVLLLALVFTASWYVQNREEASAAPDRRVHAVATPPRPLPAPVPSDPNTDYETAVALIDSGAAPDALPLLRRAAEAGQAPAQYQLAKFYALGEHVAHDLALARAWTERAASGGEVRAMHDLGVYYAHGEGGPRDEAAAFRAFRQAAERDIVDSQYNLAVLYQQGRGVAADAEEAMFWFLVAARQGDQAATRRAEDLEARLTPEQVSRARARANSFVPLTAPPA